MSERMFVPLMCILIWAGFNLLGWLADRLAAREQRKAEARWRSENQ